MTVFGALAQQYHGPVQGTAAEDGVVPAVAVLFFLAWHWADGGALTCHGKRYWRGSVVRGAVAAKTHLV